MVVALICGGGNGAHVMAGIAANQTDTEARVMTLYADEAERWTNNMNTGGFKVTVFVGGKEDESFTKKPAMVTKKPEEAVPGADIIVITVPAFAHGQYLEAIKPHMKPGVVIVGLPGQSGFDFAVRGILGEKAHQCTLMSFESLPWACRITDFGIKAEVLGMKKSLVGSILYGNPRPQRDACAMMQGLLGPFPKLEVKGHMICMTLMAVNGMIHPALLWERWGENLTPVDSPPLFYQGAGQKGAGALSAVSDEVMMIAKSIQKQRPQVDISGVQHMLDWYRRVYAADIECKDSMLTCLQTNNGYRGLTHPCKQQPDGKYLLDFTNRYFTEDIPFGLGVVRGCAEIVGVSTPQTDTILNWCQQHMGKEYLKGNKFNGKNVGETRAPQKYGISTLDQLLGF